MRRFGSVLTLCLLGLTIPSRAQTPAWQLSATVAESERAGESGDAAAHGCAPRKWLVLDATRCKSRR